MALRTIFASEHQLGIFHYNGNITDAHAQLFRGRRPRMSAAAVLSRQNTGWPSPATPQDSRVARTDIKMKESPYISSLWVVSIPPRSRRNSNSAQHVLQKSVDFLTKLPIEIRIMILSYLSPTDLCRFAKIL